MSHHFAPEFTVLPSGKEPISKKLQRNTEKSNSAKRRETEQLQFDNKQLEWKLSQLRQVMSKEKEDRGKQGNIWKSGNARIESHSRNILGRTVSGNSSATNRQKASPKSPAKSPNKVKVLKDEPLDLPQRDSLSKDLIRRFNSDAPPEDSRKKVEPARRLEHWIKFCLDKDSLDVFDLQSNLDGNLELSAVKAMNSAAIGVYFMKWGRKRLLIAAEGVIRKPKTGWGDEIYYPYTVKSQSEPPMRPEPPSKAILNKPLPLASPQPPKKKDNGGLLLQGSFDEEKNAAGFQQALIEWRTRMSSEENSSMKQLENSMHIGGKAAPEMSVHVAQCTPEPFDVKFSETSTLSYMEHILLQQHRQSDVPPLPHSLTDTVNQYLDPSYKKDNKVEMSVFTKEEEEERARYRQLFSPQNIPIATDLNTRVKFQEVDFDDGEDETDHCIVEESPPPTPPLSSAKSNVTVTIEEVTYHTDSLAQKISNSHSRSPENSWAGKHQNGNEYKENYDPMTYLKSSPRSSWLGNVLNGSYKSDNAFPYASKPPLLQNGHNKNGISYHASSILHEIGKIPINPDAFYSKGLDVFFVQSSQDDSESVDSQFHNFEGEQTLLKLQQSWNPLTSVPDENDHPIVLKSSPESDASTVIDSEQSNVVDSDGFDNGRHLSAKNSNHYDINSESDDSADERALDDLEWELASQMGNITSDGRISRLIDEWPEEGDLDIIDDPGCGSGLSTPDGNSNRPSRLATPYNENDSQIQYDFDNMEHIMMDDLNDEYIGDEV